MLCPVDRQGAVVAALGRIRMKEIQQEFWAVLEGRVSHKESDGISIWYGSRTSRRRTRGTLIMKFFVPLECEWAG